MKKARRKAGCRNLRQPTGERHCINVTGTTAFALPTVNVTVPTNVPDAGTGTVSTKLVLVTVTVITAVDPVVKEVIGVETLT